MCARSSAPYGRASSDSPVRAGGSDGGCALHEPADQALGDERCARRRERSARASAFAAGLRSAPMWWQRWSRRSSSTASAPSFPPARCMRSRATSCAATAARSIGIVRPRAPVRSSCAATSSSCCAAAKPPTTATPRRRARLQGLHAGHALRRVVPRVHRHPARRSRNGAAFPEWGTRCRKGVWMARGPVREKRSRWMKSPRCCSAPPSASLPPGWAMRSGAAAPARSRR